jgi:hypothetical protein
MRLNASAVKKSPRLADFTDKWDTMTSSDGTKLYLAEAVFYTVRSREPDER